ncbi:MAG: sugar phosphate isomerase/epimerase [Fimbriimonadaceae bacterium]|nr:sugar phosphate isomerase/epimerase [Fimbriimonadaceae bacterium]
MQYGAMQYLLGTQEQLFEAAAAMGLDGVELGYGEARDLITDPARRAATQTMAAANGMLIPSLCCGTLNRGGFASADPAVRQAALELVSASLPVAVELGAQVVLVPFFGDGHPADEAALERLVDGFRAVASAAAAAGVTLGIESQLPAATVIDVLAAIDSPAVACYYDVGNAVWLGYDPLAEIAALGDRICQVHFKEFGEQLNDRLLGEGRVPVPEACDALRAIGYEGWVVLETGTFREPLRHTPAQLAYLRQFI